MLLEGKEKDNNYCKAMGSFFIIIAVSICLPIMVNDSVRYIKEKGIEDYLNGKVEVIQTEEFNYYLWD